MPLKEFHASWVPIWRHAELSSSTGSLAATIHAGNKMPDKNSDSEQQADSDSVGTLREALQAERARNASLTAQILRHQDDLDASHKLLRDTRYALDQSAILAITDRAGRITHVNSKFCEISGYAPLELLGQDHRIVNSSHHGSEFMRKLWQQISRGLVWRGEICNLAKQGHLYWVDTTIVPLPGADGKPQQYIAIRFDITARKQAEAQLRENAALTRLGELASVVAHEVRNPLAGISGALQIIGGRMAPASEESLIVADMLERIGALNLTLTELLHYARPRPLQLLFSNALDLLYDVASHLGQDERFANVRVHIAGKPVDAEFDAVVMHGALLNLAINAAQAMDNTGDLFLEVGCENGRIWWKVRDSGPGIDAMIRARIFEPFFTTRSYGTGLGLAIVQRVSQQHGGHVDLHCPPSGGTVATIELPQRSVKESELP